MYNGYSCIGLIPEGGGGAIVASSSSSSSPSSSSSSLFKHLISRDLLKQRHIKNQEGFIARHFGVIVTSYANKKKYNISTEIAINGLNKHLGTDRIRSHVQCWFTHSNVKHFFNEAIKFAATFRDGVKLLNEAFRHFAIVLEVV